MIVTEQHCGDWRQVIEPDRRLTNAPGPEQVERSGALRIHRIGDQIAVGRLNQKGGMSDERHDRCSAVQRRRDPERYAHATRPRRPPLPQHSEYRRKAWHCGGCRVDEPLAVEVIGHEPSIVSDLLNRLLFLDSAGIVVM